MKYTKNDIDYFMIPVNDNFYLYPASENGFSSKCLRFNQPSKNNQNGYNLASDYEFDKVIKEI